MFRFMIVKKEKKTKARAGVIKTPHGNVETPAFTPVGTRASVRSLTPDDLKEIGVQLIFGNTYHLHLRPGEDVIKKFGGLGKFMHWEGPTITDSGGFQVFSLGQKRLVSFEPDVLSIKHVGGDGKLILVGSCGFGPFPGLISPFDIARDCSIVCSRCQKAILDTISL